MNQDVIDKLSYRNVEYNKEVLRKVKDNLELYLAGKGVTDYVNELYSNQINDSWFNAQCLAASKQIDKIVDPDSTFNENYSAVLQDRDLQLITSELIYDCSLLNEVGNKRLGFDFCVRRDGYLSSHQFYLNAKFACFSRNDLVTPTTNRNFPLSSMPALIRQAIEIKIKNMIGMEKVTGRNGEFKLVPISKLLRFFKDNQELVEFSIPIEHLESINSWTNEFIHTGVPNLCWQSFEAIDILHEWFTIKDPDSGAIHLHGFTKLKEGITLDHIKRKLDDQFDALFILNERSVEGRLINL
ncbi:TPA: hypothetical protein GRI37_21340 [Vibrio parahaemolyticus]|nr:hypothetical protein [Vibrio parahaemolyticus]HAS6755805.1 hypothetical protein [Vibrio parahaemolyticus]HAS6775262.1 hypothetical protein [Vibrio parahaemolyticus]HAS6863137.1 hypothetical protein [Vibrio parahaemolyticus]HAS6876914.1 hypothetical protein [Vibrio parahaemolyticus]